MIVPHKPMSSALKLTVPEYFVLHHGQDAEGKEAFQLALAELLAKDVLQAREGTLQPGDAWDQPVSRSLAAVRNLWSALDQPSDPVEFGRSVRDHFRWPSNRYVVEDVLSVLVKREFYRPLDYRLFLFVPARMFVATPSGKQAQSSIQEAIIAERRRLGLGSPWSATARAALQLGGIEPSAEASEVLRLFGDGVRDRS